MARPYKKSGDSRFDFSYELRPAVWTVTTIWAENEKEAVSLFKQRVNKPYEKFTKK
jgi:hypothetical protein